MASIQHLVVFDFDWSMADQDSDRWVFEVLAPDIRRKIRDRPKDKSVQWTDLVAESLRELSHPDRAVARPDIERALRQIPFHPAMKRGIQHLHAPASNTTIAILSNANTFFIRTILEHQALLDCFDTIITNPAAFSDPAHPNRLVLHRRVGPADPPHNCHVGCELNMCKGQELERYIDAKRQSGATFDRVIYIGDGSNDFCAVLRLRSQDVVFCRRFRGLERNIAEERARGSDSRIQCTVEYWSGAWEVEEKFKAYTNKPLVVN